MKEPKMDMNVVCDLIGKRLLECEPDWVAQLYNKIFDLEYGYSTILVYAGDGLFEFVEKE